MLAFEGPNQQFFWDMRVHWGHSVLGAPTCEFVRAALEHGNAPVRDMKNVRVPSEIFEGKCEFWMKTVLDSPILLLYLPTEERYSGFDEEVAWRHPSVRRSHVLVEEDFVVQATFAQFSSREMVILGTKSVEASNSQC